MQCSVTVTSTGGAGSAWLLQYLRIEQNPPPHPDIHPVHMDPNGNGKFVGSFDVVDGTYCLVADLLRDAEITIDLDPEYRIIQPPGDRWPVKRSVPGNMTRDVFPIYFTVGALQS